MTTEHAPVRRDEHIERNPITGEIEYRSWIDEDGILNEEYPEPVFTPEQLARMDRFSGPLMEEETSYIERRTEEKTKLRATRAAARAKKPKIVPVVTPDGE